MAIADAQRQRIEAAMDDAKIGYYTIYEPSPGTDFWRVELASDGTVIEGWPCNGVDGLTHLIQQIRATATSRRRMPAKFFGVTRRIL